MRNYSSRHTMSQARVRLNRIARQRVYRVPTSPVMHEDDCIRLMNAVSRIFQTKHACSVEFSEWKVREMSVNELQNVLRNEGR
jgi:hypothetical protein